MENYELDNNTEILVDEDEVIAVPEAEFEAVDEGAKKTRLDRKGNPKMPWSKKKKIVVSVVAVILIIVLSVGIAAGVILGRMKSTRKPNIENAHNFLSLEVYPENLSNRMGDTIPEELPTDADAVKQLAYDLYILAATNAKYIDHLAYCLCPTNIQTLGMNNFIDLDIVMLRTDTEFFRIDYRIENSVAFFNAFPGNDSWRTRINEAVDLVLTERQYYNTEMEKLKYQKIKNAWLDGEGVPYANWNNTSSIISEDRDVPVFNSTQEGVFEYFGYYLATETILNSSVELVTDEDGNSYYNVKMTLDVSNPETAAPVIHLIRDGSGDQNADYTSITIDFTIWDKGYFRSIDIHEKWEGKAIGMFDIGSTFDYHWKFSYDPEDYDMSKYADFLTTKAALAPAAE